MSLNQKIFRSKIKRKPWTCSNNQSLMKNLKKVNRQLLEYKDDD